MAERLFKEGDFVRYLGNYAMAEGPLRDEGIGRIESFEEQFGVERINPHLRDSGTYIWCDYDCHPDSTYYCRVTS